MQYTEIFTAVKTIIILICKYFAQNMDCGYTLAAAVLSSTQNVCFIAKIRKKCIPFLTLILHIGYNSNNSNFMLSD